MKAFDKIMKKLGDFVVKFRMPIIGVFISLAILGIFGVFLTKINSDVLSYLPPDSQTAQGMAFLEENFGLAGNALVALDKDTDYNNIKTYAEEIAQIEGVTTVLWIGSLDEVKVGTMDISNLDMVKEIREKAAEILTRDGNYLIMVNMSVGASTNEAGEVLEEIKDILGDERYALGGTAPISRQVYDDAMRELPYFLIVATLLVLLVLVLTAHSWIEPVIFISTLGIAVLINMGTNFIFGEISIITFCAAAILQLGMAMDYAIFLTHMYTEEREKGLDSHDSVRSALKRTFPTVLASALTTMGGMGALFLMSFTIGKDLGGVLLKGIAISLITVIVLQPCLLIMFDKVIARSKKKALDFKFKGLAKFTVKNRLLVIGIFAVLIIPAFLGQHFLNLSYLDFLPKNESPNELTAYVEDLSNQLFVAVPISSDSLLEQKTYIDNLNNSQYISAVTGLVSMLPPDMIDEQGKLKINIGITVDITDAVLNMGVDMGFISNGYALYTIALREDIFPESAAATEALAETDSISAGSFDNYILTGIVQGVKDFQDITPVDFAKINFLSIGLVLLVLILNMRSLKYPILLLLLIQFGIWFNFSIDKALNNSVNFLSYLVVGSIQLGATVDYAILLTNKYKEYRREGCDPLKAAYTASSSASMSILTAASIMLVACLSVTFLASNAVVKEIAGLVARGSVISCVLVLCVLPSILASSERFEQFVKDGGGIKGLSEKFLHDLNEQAKKSAEKLKESKDKLIESAKHFQEQVQERTDSIAKEIKEKLHLNKKNTKTVEEKNALSEAKGDVATLEKTTEALYKEGQEASENITEAVETKEAPDGKNNDD
ncbi:MAG: hypothetical protein EOM87_02750 [Clostridia bacterium]|nr:hypothetical protein [Clostridia bacterium]